MPKWNKMFQKILNNQYLEVNSYTAVYKSCITFDVSNLKKKSNLSAFKIILYTNMILKYPLHIKNWKIIPSW